MPGVVIPGAQVTSILTYSESNPGLAPMPSSLHLRSVFGKKLTPEVGADPAWY